MIKGSSIFAAGAVAMFIFLIILTYFYYQGKESVNESIKFDNSRKAGKKHERTIIYSPDGTADTLTTLIEFYYE